MTRETQKSISVALFLILMFGALKHAAKISPSVTDLAFAFAFLFQVFVPIWLIEREGRSLSDFKIWLPKIGNRLDWHALWLDLRRVLFFTLLIFPLFFVAYYGLQMFLAAQNGRVAHFSPALPDNLLNFTITSLLIVAVAEEIFYRGYVQTTLLKQWSVPVAFFVTNLLFALGHFIGDYQFGRLLPFFPGLLFSYLVLRSRSIVGAVLFHGLCNIYAELLRASYYWSV